ncbi:MAG: hypothetical protein LAO21_03100 [Acidobacteriia bacterium]|nr:hypothetical protein [Terriglobia bacterium]
MVRRVLALAAMVFFLLGAATAAEAEPCSKPKVYIKFAFVKGTEEQLNQDKGHFQTDEQWTDELSKIVMDQLSKFAGDVDLILDEKTVFYDDNPQTEKVENSFNYDEPGEYSLRIVVSVITARGPDGVRDSSLHPNYWVGSHLGAADRGGTIAALYNTEMPNITSALQINVLQYGNLAKLIEKYESTHFRTLREPKLESSVDPSWVSPEPGERKAKIWAKVTDCRGRSGEGTNVYIQAKTSPKDRGTIRHLKASEWIADLPIDGGSFDQIRTTKDGTIEAEYTLEKGTDPGSERITVHVLGRGEKRIEQILIIKIKGLKLEVKPDQTTLLPGAETKVRFTLFKTDPDGGQEPFSGRKIHLSIQGLNDGKVTPLGEIATNEQGQATTTYHAGNKDKSVTFIANYQPMGYNEGVTGKGVVKVTPPTFSAMLTGTLHEEHTEDCREAPPGYTKISKENRTKDLRVQVNLALDKDSIVSNYVRSTGELRWRVTVKDTSVGSYSGAENHTSYNYAGDLGKPPLLTEGEVELKRTVTSAQPNPDEANQKHEVVIYFDAQTKKIKRVYFNFPRIDLTWEETKTAKSRRGVETATGRQIRSTGPTETSDTLKRSFSPHPVEDSVTTPSGGSGWHKDSENSSGDGIRSASGHGKHTVTREGKCSKTTEEETFQWQLNMEVARR